MYEQIRLAEVHELKLLFMEEYNEYIKLVQNIEIYYQKLKLSWSKFHLFYQQNGSSILERSECEKGENTVNKPREENAKGMRGMDGRKKKGAKKTSDKLIYFSYENIEEDLKIIQQKKKRNDCYFFKACNNIDNSFVLHSLKDVPNAVELYINIKIQTLNKLKNGALGDINNFCKTHINKFFYLIILCEIKLNNVHMSQKDVNHSENNIRKKCVQKIIFSCKEIIQEVTKNIIPFFFSFNIFSAPNYFNYHFKHFHNYAELEI
ncbi:conserved Plasmodium protein, unknown function [Plasmodium ovale wallikeri]|uniref:Uncharacterized protein n=1 Tax=Plasmodium ovale wallikeri TaxID=864142 RepID=A0A1A8YGB9_PLAOA|nr:conserved Plasmodium protein, unknown function [Plasmodium ovale wallikeri]